MPAQADLDLENGNVTLYIGDDFNLKEAEMDELLNLAGNKKEISETFATCEEQKIGSILGNDQYQDDTLGIKQ